MKKMDENGAVVIQIGILAIVILVIVALIIAAAISLVIGFFGFIGICFLVAAAYILWKKKGNVAIKLTSPFAICVIAGLILIGVSSLGLEVLQLDLSVIPGLKELHMMVNPP